MSKLYEKYLSLKKQDYSTLYLFKSGIFYLFLDEDAKKMSTYLNLKLTNLNEKIVKCGFPVNTLEKYSTLLKDNGYSVKIVNRQDEQLHSVSNYILNSDVKNFIQKLSNIDSEHLSIREAYLLLDDIKKQAQSLIKKM